MCSMVGTFDHRAHWRWREDWMALLNLPLGEAEENLFDFSKKLNKFLPSERAPTALQARFSTLSAYFFVTRIALPNFASVNFKIIYYGRQSISSE